MILAAATPQAERQNDQTNSEGVLVQENTSSSIPRTQTEETYIGGWIVVARKTTN